MACGFETGAKETKFLDNSFSATPLRVEATSTHGAPAFIAINSAVIDTSGIHKGKCSSSMRTPRASNAVQSSPQMCEGGPNTTFRFASGCRPLAIAVGDSIRAHAKTQLFCRFDGIKRGLIRDVLQQRQAFEIQLLKSENFIQLEAVQHYCRQRC